MFTGLSIPKGTVHIGNKAMQGVKVRKTGGALPMEIVDGFKSNNSKKDKKINRDKLKKKRKASRCR